MAKLMTGGKISKIGIGEMVVGGRKSRSKPHTRAQDEENCGMTPPPPPPPLRGFPENDLKFRRGSGFTTPQPQPKHSSHYKGGARPRDPSYQINV